MGSLGDLVLSGNYVRQSRVSTAQTNSSFYNYLPAYGLLNGTIGLQNVGGRPIDITLFGTNLTNKAKPVGVLDQYAGSTGTVGLTYTEPRMYGIRIGYRFGN